MPWKNKTIKKFYLQTNCKLPPKQPKTTLRKKKLLEAENRLFGATYQKTKKANKNMALFSKI